MEERQSQSPRTNLSTDKIVPWIDKNVKKKCREVLPFQKIILSLCYEDCEPTYKSSLKTLDLIVFSAPHRRPELHQRTGRLQGPSSGLSSLNYWTSRFYVIPLRPVHTAQRANSLAVTIFAEALTASPNALRRSSNERLRWFTIFDARRVRAAYFG